MKKRWAKQPATEDRGQVQASYCPESLCSLFWREHIYGTVFLKRNNKGKTAVPTILLEEQITASTGLLAFHSVFKLSDFAGGNWLVQNKLFKSQKLYGSLYDRSPKSPKNTLGYNSVIVFRVSIFFFSRPVKRSQNCTNRTGITPMAFSFLLLIKMKPTERQNDTRFGGREVMKDL